MALSFKIISNFFFYILENFLKLTGQVMIHYFMIIIIVKNFKAHFYR